MWNHPDNIFLEKFVYIKQPMDFYDISFSMIYFLSNVKLTPLETSKLVYLWGIRTKANRFENRKQTTTRLEFVILFMNVFLLNFPSIKISDFIDKKRGLKCAMIFRASFTFRVDERGPYWIMQDNDIEKVLKAVSSKICLFILSLGNGCSTAGRPVTSDTRGPGFKPGRLQFYQTFAYC